jgi:tetratricopeptide (TPR) repeat protein
VTTLTAIFDEGKFNCVSSTALYYLVGSRLGLKLKLISIPGAPFQAGHASLDLIDGGKKLQVEPTNPDGFDWQTKIKRPGVVVWGLVPDRKDGREVDPLGLAATIYSNRGVDSDKSDSPKRLESARMYAAALSLDPLTPTATHNLLSLFTNWGPQLAKEDRFEDAIRVLALGRSLAPQCRDLDHNLEAVWSKFITATFAAGKDQEALAQLRRAAEMLPKERDFASPSVWFISRAQDKQREGGWEASLADVEASLPLLAGAETKKLREFRSGLFRRWSQEHLENKDYEASVKVLARGYALDAADREIHSGLGYHAAQALKGLDDGDAGPMLAHFRSLTSQFPKVKDITEAGRSHAIRQVHELTDAGKFAEALGAASRYKPLVTDAKHQNELAVMVYAQWGRKLREEGQWKEALGKLLEGRKAFPQERDLENSMAATIDAWADGFMRDNRWDEAIRIYNVGLTEYLPDSNHLKNNKEYCEAKKAGK